MIQASYRHRKKRHRIRKILLVLDYIVECIGCLFIFFVFFIGEKRFLQHVLLSVGTFIYGVPIPFAYLLNESRVRNTIIDEGWVEGFKSIFYSNEKIKQLKRKRIVSYLHPDGITRHCKLYARKLSEKDDMDIRHTSKENQRNYYHITLLREYFIATLSLQAFRLNFMNA